MNIPGRRIVGCCAKALGSAFLSLLLVSWSGVGLAADSFNPSPNGAVITIAIQTDGKIIIGGSFTVVCGQPRTNIARLNADGTLDSTFNPGANGAVYCLAVQEDGLILAGGAFTALAGQGCNRVGRLLSDGTPDPGFAHPSLPYFFDVSALALRPDGKILLGSGSASGPQFPVVRLNTDGTLDSSFVPPPWTANPLPRSAYSLLIQPSGDILAFGAFPESLTINSHYIEHLNANGGRISRIGILNTPSLPGGVFGSGAQADGSVLFGGQFFWMTGQGHLNLARLNPDYTIDPSTNLAANAAVIAFAVQTDGKVYVGGAFTNLNGSGRYALGRLNANGSLDTSYVGANLRGTVNALALQSDGKLLVGGSFTNYGGLLQKNLARLASSAAPAEDLRNQGSTVTWLRSGPLPELLRTSFDYSADGAAWISLGAGVRISGGWQVAAGSAPPGALLRARGTASGSGNSSWIVETIVSPPIITLQPANQTGDAGATAVFGVQASGPGPFGYQWYQGTVPLLDSMKISGSQNSTLSVSNLLGNDAGAYCVVITNNYGSVTSQVATLTVNDPVIVTQPVNIDTIAGGTAQFTVSAFGSTPLTYQWRGGDTYLADGPNCSGAHAATLSLSNVSAADAVSYSVIVRNDYGTATSSVATLFLRVPPDTFNPAPNSPVNALGVQSDNKLLVGGTFSALAGQQRARIGRLNADGTLDGAFAAAVSGDNQSRVASLVLQEDGKILVGGRFTALNGQPHGNVGRLNADGTLDPAFIVGSGANGDVNSIVVQSDGKILLGGTFTDLEGQSHTNLGRLTPDGALDSNFNAVANGEVGPLVIQADGQILLGGRFTQLDSQPRNYLGRLNSDGTLEPGFHPNPNDRVTSLLVQPDGKILVGGYFTILAGQSRTNLGRLNSDGSLDNNFNPGVAGPVLALALQANGQVLIGGLFSSVGGQPRSRIARLNPDGTLDNDIDPGADGAVNAFAIQDDGNVLIGGAFQTLSGQPRSGLGRIFNTLAAAQSISYNGWSIIWSRTGSIPEVWRTTFDASITGGPWFSLGEGTRSGDGWLPIGWYLPPDPAQVNIRARGFIIAAGQQSSGWFVESVSGPPLILVQPASRTNFAGTSATFSVNVAGSPPFTYQWRHGTSTIPGATTASLNLQNLQLADAGGYSVSVVNTLGSVTSAVAMLTVLQAPTPPLILTRDGGLGFRNGQFGFNVQAPGQAVVIEGSTNLATWTALSTNMLGTDLLYFTDPASDIVPMRFYRARLQ